MDMIAVKLGMVAQTLSDLAEMVEDPDKRARLQLRARNLRSRAEGMQKPREPLRVVVGGVQ